MPQHHPPLRTERLLLRGYREDDLESTLAYYSDPEVVRHTPFEIWTEEYARMQVTKRIARTGISGPGTALALVVEHEGQLIGDLVAWPADDTLSRIEVGWAFHPDFGGRGLATEAVEELLRILFTDYSIHRVIAQVDTSNSASARLCERVGMIAEAHLRQDCWNKGEWRDTITYGLLSDEWRRAGEARRL